MKLKARPRTFERSLRFVWVAAIGAAVFLWAALTIHGDHASSYELTIFRFVNDLPGLFVVVFWPCMQLGNMIVIPLGALAAAVTRHLRLALGFLLAGGAKFEAARAIKDAVTRHRPAVFLDDVHIRVGSTATGLGFVSGHAVIAVAAAVLIHPYLQRGPMRVALWAVTVVVLISRVYVGAHLPLDVIAGGGVGLAIGSLVNLAVGTPRERDQYMSR